MKPLHERQSRLRFCILPGFGVGPDFKAPPPPTVSSFTAEPAKDATGLRWKSGEDIAQDWWTVFRSPQLDALIMESKIRGARYWRRAGFP